MAASASTSTGAFASSSSSSHSTWAYDVFLSFRGVDTRKGFADHLYHALTDAGIYTFRDDDELRRGEDLSSELLSAIEGSRFSVVVLSKNYAASRWCLEELEKIRECGSMRDQRILPIFYHVHPSDVRHLRGSFADAFAEHKKRYSLDKDKVHRWRVALKEVGNFAGWHVQDTPEAEFIRLVVQHISDEVNPTMLSIAVYPVGIAPRVKEVTPLLCIEVGAVRMVGIWGMGGAGKTSISKAIYNRFFHSFEAISFIANIRETCKQSGGQVRLQKQLLSDTLKTSKIKINSVDNGITVIKRRLCRKKVLVILDDVSHVDQVNAIARSRDCFGPGSRIVITTRDEQLLKVLDVDEIYPAEKMNDEEALRLFSWHAFKKSDPTEDFMDLSRSILAYCGGLPLALEVLGSYLYLREIPEWKILLEKLKITPPNKVQRILKISYDGLDDDDTIQDIFLDIACFFIGMEENFVKQIMNGCGFFGEIGIKVLIERCLLSIDRGGKLAMHDLLRDMGRAIVRGENRKDPGKRSRVWRHQDAVDILVKHQGREAIEGLALKLPSSSYKDLDARAFEAMKMLRLLQLDYVQLRGDYKHLFEELRWLRWHGFPLKFMPNNFYPRRSVAIDLQYSKLKQAWKSDKQLFEELKFLNLSHSRSLTQTPNFARFPNLEELVLKYCTNLFEVHKSIGNLCNLVLVDFEGCKNLESLPRCLYLRKSIQTLIISGCSKIDTLPEEFGEMESLTTFLADDISIKQVPCTIIKLRKLKYVSLCGYTGSPASLFDSVFWSRTSARGSLSSVNLLPTPPQGLNSVRELCRRGCTLLNNGVLKGFSTLKSFGSSKLQSLAPNYFTRHQSWSIPRCDKLWKPTAMIHKEGCNNTSKQSIFQECSMSGIGGSFGTFIRGDDMPEYFRNNEGSSICFKVPCNVDEDLKGFIVCIVYSASSVDKAVAEDLPSMTIINSTKNRIQTKRPVSVDEVIFPEDHIWQYTVSQSSFNLEDGDEVQVSVDFGSQITVQKIGFCLVYDSIGHGKMIDYQSTSNKDVVAVNDDEDAPKDQVAIKFKRTSSDDNEEASHGGFCDTREAKRLRCEKDINDTTESSDG